MTWLTASAMIPMTADSPPHSTSVITMQVSFPISLGAWRNFTDRSTTGTTLPRRLMTPRTHSGIFGTFVITSHSMISFTFRRLTAYSSPPIRNVRYWDTSCSFNCFGSSFLICMSSALKPREVVFDRRAVRFHLESRRCNRDVRGRLRFGVRDNRFADGGGISLACYPEERHELLKGFGLCGQFFRCAGEFFRTGSI